MVCRILPLLLLLTGGVAAEPVAVRRAASLPPDPGIGLCATAIHVTVDNAIKDAEDARAYLALPRDNVLVDDKIVFKVPVINLRNSRPEAGGDFTGPMSGESLFPFSASPDAKPPGNDRNFVLRLRGYLGVPAGLSTVAVLGDDGYALSIGGAAIFPAARGLSSRQVLFPQAGLYAIELVAFQNDGAAALELSQASGAQAEVRGAPTPVGPAFRLPPPGRLYPALAGATDCSECDSDSACRPGDHCRDGLCQACAIGPRCGPACRACPAERPACDRGGCVECTAAEPGLCAVLHLVCDAESRTCVPCSDDSQCEEGELCDRTSGGCVPRPALVYTGGCGAAPGQAPISAVLLLLGLCLFRKGRRCSSIRS